MTKRILDKENLKKVIKTTQSIEGYKEPSKEVIAEAKILREKYGIIDYSTITPKQYIDCAIDCVQYADETGLKI